MNPHLSRYAGPRIRPDRSQRVEFYDPAPDRAWRVVARVPDPRHVATRLLLPALADIGVTHRPHDRVVVASAIDALLDGIPQPLPVDGDAYKGLWAAVTLPVNYSDCSGFQRSTYLAAILDATLRELPAPRTAAPGDSSASMTPAERKARFKSRHAERERAVVLTVLRRTLDGFPSGEALTRAELVEAVVNFADEAHDVWDDLREKRLNALDRDRHNLRVWRRARAAWRGPRDDGPAQPDPTPFETWADAADDYDLGEDITPVRIAPRRAASLIVALAPSLGLVETRTSNARRFTLQEEPDMTITETLRAETAALEANTAAIDANIDARERQIAALQLSQDAYLASGDRVGALRAQRSRTDLAAAGLKEAPVELSTAY